jgi:predicted nucleotidyltransferase/DNA-binding transcriptional regulator YiaG
MSTSSTESAGGAAKKHAQGVRTGNRSTGDSGGIVARLRMDAGLTQKELADLSGVAQSNIAAYESGRRQPSPTMLARLSQAAQPRPSTMLARHRVQVRALGKKHHADRIRVFGSVAAGRDRSGSDLDLLVRFSPGASLFDQVNLASEAEALLGVHVDVVSEAGLRGPRGEGIAAQARPL